MLRRIDPVTGIAVLACVVWTIWTRWSGQTISEAGAVNEHTLWEGEYWRLVTSMLLHDPSGWLHLILNCASLYFVGRIVARVCGPRVYVSVLLLAGQAGLAASFLCYPEVEWRVGISGGIAGLLGLLLAVEWAVSKSLGEFLRQRNTMIIFIIALTSTGFALWWERRQGVVVDHAAHAGGFLFGFFTGVAYYGRRRVRRLHGVLVALALGVVPIAYVCHPLLNTDYLLFKGNRAYRAKDLETAARYYERVLGTHPGHTIAGARLAVVRDDPARLDGLKAPAGAKAAYELLRACLVLAERRLTTDVEQTRALVERATGVDPGTPGLWIDFAVKAEQRQQVDMAYVAYQEATSWIRREPQPWRAWMPASRALRLIPRRTRGDEPPQEGIKIVLDAAATAREAAGGLGDSSGLNAAARTQLEAAVRDVALWADNQAQRLEPLRGQLPELPRLNAELTALFLRLAENTGREENRPLYRFRSALSWWRELEMSRIDPEAFELVQRRFQAAWEEGAELGNREIQGLVEQWFTARGLPVPEGDLADDGDGG